MEMLIPECDKPFLVFDNVIPADKIESVKNELQYLNGFLSKETGSALDWQGNSLKNNSGLWLSSYYNNPNYSPIYSSIIKIYSQEVVEAISSFDNAFIYYPHVAECLNWGCLLSKYEEGEYYKPHVDNAYYTATLFLNDDFDGGEFYFDFDGEEVEVENKSNRLVLFPSIYKHSVKPIKSNCRYSVTMFLHRETYK